MNISLSNSEYLKPSFDAIYKVIRNRHYIIRKDGDQIAFERKSKDINDLMGGELYKLCPVAKGKITNQSGGIQLDLKIRLLPLFNGLLITLILIFGISTLLAFDISSKAGTTMGVLSLIICLIPMSLLYGGIKNFKKELEEDLKYLDSNTDKA